MKNLDSGVLDRRDVTERLCRDGDGRNRATGADELTPLTVVACRGFWLRCRNVVGRRWCLD